MPRIIGGPHLLEKYHFSIVIVKKMRYANRAHYTPSFTFSQMLKSTIIP